MNTTTDYFYIVGLLVTEHPELFEPILMNTVQKVTAMNVRFRLYLN